MIVFQSFRFKHAIFYDTTFSDFTWLWIVLLDGSNVVRTSFKSMGCGQQQSYFKISDHEIIVNRSK